MLFNRAPTCVQIFGQNFQVKLLPQNFKKSPNLATLDFQKQFAFIARSKRKKKFVSLPRVSKKISNFVCSKVWDSKLK